MSNLILVTDILETKVRKEKELNYYQKELEKLQQKMFFIKKDIELTNIIINIIEKDNVIDFKEQMLLRQENDGTTEENI